MFLGDFLIFCDQLSEMSNLTLCTMGAQADFVAKAAYCGRCVTLSHRHWIKLIVGEAGSRRFVEM